MIHAGAGSCFGSALWNLRRGLLAPDIHHLTWSTLIQSQPFVVPAILRHFICLDPVAAVRRPSNPPSLHLLGSSRSRSSSQQLSVTSSTLIQSQPFVAPTALRLPSTPPSSQRKLGTGGPGGRGSIETAPTTLRLPSESWEPVGPGAGVASRPRQQSSVFPAGPGSGVLSRPHQSGRVHHR